MCGLVKGLSHRAYRKEITRGVDELSAKLRLLERGQWCADREPMLKAYAAGLADDEQQRQARQHLSHCRHCVEFVGKLRAICTRSEARSPGLGWPTRWAATRSRSAIGSARPPSERATPRSACSRVAAESRQRPWHRQGQRAGPAAPGSARPVASPSWRESARSQVVAACIGTGAATACVATGLAPVHLPTTAERAEVEQAPAERPAHHGASSRPLTLPSQVGHEVAAPPPGARPAPPPETVDTPIEPEPAPAPPVQQEFGLVLCGRGEQRLRERGRRGRRCLEPGEGTRGAVTQELGLVATLNCKGRSEWTE